MATVFLAHEISLDRKVAIKVMSPAMVYGAGMVERFKREARTAANLSHPNIIPVYGVREVEGLLFFIMKLVEGTPLDAIIRELGQLPLPMVEAIMAQVAGAFGYAHRHGVVHRDIKPSNILIDDEGWAVVTDFGIAKVEASVGLTQTGVAVGTPTYMSPEQCSGGEITGASDQYSLGVVAYEMLAGRPPFTGTAMMALLFSHFNEPPPPLEAHRPDCPEPIRTAVMRMLEKEPSSRWPSLEAAVGAMGARQLAHDDPTRSQLISLARTGLSRKLVSQVQTPRSPVPFTKRTGGATPLPVAGALAPARRQGLGLVGAGAALAVAAMALVYVANFLSNRDGSARIAEPTPPLSAPAPSGPLASPEEGSAPPPVLPRATATQPPTKVPPKFPAVALQIAAPAADSRVNQPSPAVATPSTVVAPTPTPAPLPGPPPAAAPAVAVPLPAPVSTAVVDERAAVTAAIQSYARALEAGDLAQALRAYPVMPLDQRQGLEALWKSGGSMKPRWTVSEITVDGDAATARVVGINAVTTPRGGSSDLRVALRARLERRGSEWRLASLVN
jgi:serine/threonine-protein kinase